MLKQRSGTGVSCNGEKEQRLIIVSKGVLRYLDVLHLLSVQSEHFFRESCCGSFASLIQQIQTLFTRKVVATSECVSDFGREALIKLFGSIFELEAAAKCWLSGLVAEAHTSPGASATFSKECGTIGESRVGFLK